MSLKYSLVRKLNFLIGNDSFKAEHQFLNISLLLGSIFFIFFIAINVYFKIDLALTIAKIAGLAISLTLFYFSRFRRMFNWTSKVYFITLIFSLVYIGVRNGGVTGGIAPIFTAVLALMLFITRGRSLKILLVLWIVSISALFFLEYFHPSLIRPYFNRDQQYIDLYLSYSSGIFMTAMVVILVKRLYKKEKLNMEEMMEKYRDINSDLKKNISNNKESLSIREREICNLLLEGLSNLEIADKLFISEGTVKSHINKIYKKLGAKNRVEVLDYY
jgi:DNA-binding CsgD family transcriptional regulator